MVWELIAAQLQSLKHGCLDVYLVQFGLGAGEGERKSHRKLFILDFLLLHEITQAICDMAKELRNRKETYM